MKLWSYHSPGFSLVDGEYDPEKSEYYKSYPAAYEDLWNRVGTRELVWCCTSEDCWPQKKGDCEWALEVPETAFLKIVDSMVWNGILGNKGVGPSGRLRDALFRDAMRKAPNDPYEWFDSEVQRMLHPPGDPWASLFLTDVSDPRADVLLKYPIEQSWVISTKLY